MSVKSFTGLMLLRGTEIIRALPVASGVVITTGDLVKFSGSSLVTCTGATDDINCLGVAKEDHASTDKTGSISVAIRNAGAIYLANLNAATTAIPGDLFQMLSGASAKLVKSTTDAVAMSVQQITSALTCEVILMLPNTTAAVRLVGDAS